MGKSFTALQACENEEKETVSLVELCEGVRSDILNSVYYSDESGLHE